MFVFILFFFESKRGRKYKAFKAPHAIKVQFAPCQKPLTMKIIIVFLIFIHSPPILPPSGMYK
jgi:hypothetical protein